MSSPFASAPIASLIPGIERQDQTRIATAVSELARNAYGYAGGGRAEFVLDATTIPQRFVVRICDSGPGIDNLQLILDGQYRSPSGMGLGLIGARRLMDTFSINSKPGKGTTVEVGHKLPHHVSAMAARQAHRYRVQPEEGDIVRSACGTAGAEPRADAKP